MALQAILFNRCTQAQFEAIVNEKLYQEFRMPIAEHLKLLSDFQNLQVRVDRVLNGTGGAN